MIQSEIASLGDVELLAAAREVVHRSCIVEADLLGLLGEIDERKLYLERAFSSMFAFCTRELGFPRARHTTASSSRERRGSCRRSSTRCAPGGCTWPDSGCSRRT